MDSILPDRLLTLVRPRRIRNLKRCVQACGCNITTPRYAPQFGSRLHFKRCQALPKETPFSFFRDPFFGDPFFVFFFCFFLALQRLARLKCNLEPNCGAYLGVVMLQPHACTQRFRFRILRRKRSFPGRTSVRSLSGRIASIWETPFKERGWIVFGGRRCCVCRGGLRGRLWSFVFEHIFWGQTDPCMDRQIAVDVCADLSVLF